MKEKNQSQTNVSTTNNKDCCSTIEEESDESSEHQRHLLGQISELDSQKLHYLNGSAASSTSHLNLSKDNGGGSGAAAAAVLLTGDNFNQKFDQLAKLHDLYASVSSISAKSQSHLEERSRNNSHNVRGGHQQQQQQSSSTFSLGALVFSEPNNKDDCNSSNCSVSDINSLCSEPVMRLFDYNSHHSNSLVAASDISRLNYAGLEDNSRGNNNNNANGLSISLSDLGFENGCDPLSSCFEQSEVGGRFKHTTSTSSFKQQQQQMATADKAAAATEVTTA